MSTQAALVWIAGFATVVIVGHVAGLLGVVALIPNLFLLGRLVRIVVRP